MNNKTKHLGPLEKKVMQAIWEKKCSSVRSVLEEISKEKKVAYTTIMTVMTRLVDKSILERTKEGKSYCYQPKETKQNFVSELVHQTMNNFINKFGEEAVVAFMDETDKLSQVDKDKLLNQLKE